MRYILESLLRFIARRKPKAARPPARKTHLQLETLETRWVPTGISFSNYTLLINGTSGNDKAEISINTLGDNNRYNDQVVCKLTHGNVTDTLTIPLYKSSVNGPVHNIDDIQFNGYGGSDTFRNFTDLSFDAYAYNQAQSGQTHMSFDAATGQFTMKGTGADDNAQFGLSFYGLEAQLSHDNQTMKVTMPIYQPFFQDTKQVIKSLEFEGSWGDDYFNNDTALPVEAWGESGADTLLGGSAGDALYGDGKGHGSGPESGWVPGNDIISGRGGDDEIYGGKGNDMISGGDGDDDMEGGPGDDLVWGQGGKDYIYGGEGADLIWGGEGDDTLVGNSGNDHLYGEGGDDYLRGDGQIGEFGNDYLSGGIGNDQLYDGYGANEIHGGEGDDQFFVSRVSYYNLNTDVNHVYGDGGNDYMRTYGGTAYLHGGEGNDTLIAADSGLGGTDYLYGEGGDDYLIGGKHGTWMEGGAGDDWLAGWMGDDTLLGGEGNDLLQGGTGADFLDGGNGNDLLIGGGCYYESDPGAPDTLVGGAGADTFYLDLDSATGLNRDVNLDFNAAEGDVLTVSVSSQLWFDAVQFQKKP